MWLTVAGAAAALASSVGGGQVIGNDNPIVAVSLVGNQVIAWIAAVAIQKAGR